MASLFEFNYVKSIFVENNYISITKDTKADWFVITNDIRNHIKRNIEPLTIAENISTTETQNPKNFEGVSKEIINILDTYIKPAVTADGGNIIFDSYDANTKLVKSYFKRGL